MEALKSAKEVREEFEKQWKERQAPQTIISKLKPSPAFRDKETRLTELHGDLRESVVTTCTHLLRVDIDRIAEMLGFGHDVSIEVSPNGDTITFRW